MRAVLALIALALAAPHAARAAHAQPYFVTDLTPDGFTKVQATGISLFNSQVGYGQSPDTEDNPHALLWYGTPESVVDLNPNGFDISYALSVDGSTQVGYGHRKVEKRNRSHALLWRGTARSVVDMTPQGFSAASINAAFGNVQVGYAANNTVGAHAFVWYGTPASAIDLHPAGFNQSFALGVQNDTQVGFGNGVPTGGLNHALLWKSHANTAVDLNPPGFTESQANAVYGSVTVGFANNGETHHAYLWHNKRPKGTDLNPQGYRYSIINAIYENTQVGFGVSVPDGHVHALLWHGTADSVIDLNPSLPAGILVAEPTGINRNGDIVGYGVDANNNYHALLWRPNRTGPPVISRLSTDVIDMGSPAFTLIVYGTKLVPSTVVRWNGRTLATTYVRAHLTALVPASLLARTGTADITVQTPNVATSGATPFHIRPVIASLSPASVKAKSPAFTLTVTGAGFTRDSLVKFNYQPVATTYISPTKLTATVPAALVAAHGSKSVMVTLPNVATSRGLGFTVTP